MATVSMLLADGITIKIGNNAWSLGWNVLVYLLMAAIVGTVAEALLGWRAPLGIVGASIAALVGVWLMTQVISISGIPDYYIPTTPQVPFIRALIGAIILVGLWHFLFGGFRRRPGATAT